MFLKFWVKILPEITNEKLSLSFEDAFASGQEDVGAFSKKYVGKLPGASLIVTLSIFEKRSSNGRKAINLVLFFNLSKRTSFMMLFLIVFVDYISQDLAVLHIAVEEISIILRLLLLRCCL